MPLTKSTFTITATVTCEVEHEEGQLPTQPVDIFVYPADGNHLNKEDVGADSVTYEPVGSFNLVKALVDICAFDNDTLIALQHHMGIDEASVIAKISNHIGMSESATMDAIASAS